MRPRERERIFVMVNMKTCMCAKNGVVVETFAGALYTSAIYVIFGK